MAGLDGIDLFAMAGGEDALGERGCVLEPPHRLGGPGAMKSLGGTGGVVFGDDFVEEFLVDRKVFGGETFDLAVETGAGCVE